MIRETLQTVNLGIKSLLLHKLRSALTTLGLMIGVAAVVAMLAIGEGASQEAQDRIKALGSTNILIKSKKPPVDENDAQQSAWTPNYYGLTYRDHDRIAGTLAHAVFDVVPARYTDKEIRVEANWYNGVLVGTTPQYLGIMGMQLDDGVWLNESHLDQKANVAIIGASMAERLFPLQNPIGQPIKASGDRFVVIGVLDKLGRRSGSLGRSVDDCIYIPITTSKTWFGDIQRKMTGGSFSTEGVELHEIKVKVKQETDVIDAAKVIREMLKETHDQDDYEITVPLELLREAQATKRRYQLLLFFIASISLIVGGIGIMNVMLATVTERTREIGIRRALGAKRADIVSQFLVETVVLAGFGGLLGLLVGISTPYIAAAFSDAKAVIRPEHPAMAFGISALVGVVAGLYPAWRAANMDPVEALRHE